MNNKQQNKNMAYYLNNFFDLKDNERMTNRQYYHLIVGALALVGIFVLFGFMYSRISF